MYCNIRGDFKVSEMNPMLFKCVRRVERMLAHDSPDPGERRMSTSPQCSSPLIIRWSPVYGSASSNSREGEKVRKEENVLYTQKKACLNDLGLWRWWYIHIYSKVRTPGH